MTTKLLQFVRRLLPRNQERAIFEFRALVRDELKNLPYPPGYVVSTRWAREIDDALRVVEKAQDPREIALFGMQIRSMADCHLQMPIIFATVADNITNNTLN